jgi:TATA-binding protein-associated factor
MLDVVQKGLLSSHFPHLLSVSARIDGSTPPATRVATAKRFNVDPSLSLLLLTTAVGGLGLSLVGADTVIFLDHDWNPARDAQAQDRAHRVGQTRVVTVYRLLAADTLEERIMSLQRMKENMARAVVTDANKGLGGIRGELGVAEDGSDAGDSGSGGAGGLLGLLGKEEEEEKWKGAAGDKFIVDVEGVDLASFVRLIKK